MSNHVYSISEVVGTSPDGIEQAVNNAVAQAARTVRNLDWFEVVRTSAASSPTGPSRTGR